MADSNPLQALIDEAKAINDRIAAATSESEKVMLHGQFDERLKHIDDRIKAADPK